MTRAFLLGSFVNYELGTSCIERELPGDMSDSQVGDVLSFFVS